MRVIAGKARGVRLSSVPGTDTRPTLDRVKEALFNILQTWVPGSDFLDLFAGNGGIGIEALSRGARHAVFVDLKPQCTRMIRANLQAAKVDGAQGLTMPVERALERLAKAGSQFDIIFLDPPYGRQLVGKTLAALEGYDLLRPGGLVVAEYGAKEEIDLGTSKFERVRQEKYGDTALGFFTLREDERECE
jgi:16S rRNA (guanine966-N2)-methyltransferase